MIVSSEAGGFAVRIVRTAWHGREPYPAASCYELVLPLWGAYRVRCARFSTLLDPGRYVVGIPDEEVELFAPISNGYESVIIGFDREIVAQVVSGGALPNSGVNGPVAELGIRRLRAALLGDRGPVVIRELAWRVVSATFDGDSDAGHRREAAGSLGRQAADRRTFDEARAVLSVELQLSAYDLAARVGCSPGQLSRVFVRQTGRGVAAYRSALRAGRALQALTEDRYETLADLAAETGFADHAHLTRTLRDRYGELPSRLRQLLSAEG